MYRCNITTNIGTIEHYIAFIITYHRHRNHYMKNISTHLFLRHYFEL